MGEGSVAALLHQLVEEVVESDDDGNVERRLILEVGFEPEGILDQIEVSSDVSHGHAVVQDVVMSADQITVDGDVEVGAVHREDDEVLTEGEKLLFLDHQDLIAFRIHNENFGKQDMPELIAHSEEGLFVQGANFLVFGEGENAALDEEEVVARFVSDRAGTTEGNDLVFDNVFHSKLLCNIFITV